jgi:hypothetical protein
VDFRYCRVESICIVCRSLPNPATAEIVPIGNPIVIIVSATRGPLPPRKDAHAIGFSEDISSANSDVSSNATFVIYRPCDEVISNNKTICEDMAFGAYEESLCLQPRPAISEQTTQAGSKLTDLPQPDLGDSGLRELGVLTDLLPAS